MNPIDLDALAELEAEATEAPWLSYSPRSVSDEKCRAVLVECMRTADATLIVAARNALPALIAELRAMREVVAAAREFVHDEDEDRQATLDALIAALAKVDGEAHEEK